jgi:hypothetical protein
MRDDMHEVTVTQILKKTAIVFTGDHPPGDDNVRYPATIEAQSFIM